MPTPDAPAPSTLFDAVTAAAPPTPGGWMKDRHLTRPGQRFKHRRAVWARRVDGTERTGDVFVITSISDGTVYYRPDDGTVGGATWKHRLYGDPTRKLFGRGFVEGCVAEWV